MVLFEVPTGVVADTVGRRMSYLLGTVTLSVSTLLYVLLWQIDAAFWAWALVSLVIGLGFTFFSGAVEAWLVDALHGDRLQGEHRPVFGEARSSPASAMLAGSVAGGFIAQQLSLGAPFVIRGVVLLVMFGLAFRLMHDVGFTPEKGGRPLAEMRRDRRRLDRLRLARAGGEVADGRVARSPAASASTRFYALQPYLLQLWGDPDAYQIAGLSAGDRRRRADPRRHAAPQMRGLVRTPHFGAARGGGAERLALGLIGVVDSFWAVIGVIVLWGLLFAASRPIRQTYINGMIPSRQRATILSFDSMMLSSGGVWAQPVLGHAADVWGYAPSYLICGRDLRPRAAVPALSRQNARADTVEVIDGQPAAAAASPA